MTRIYGDRPEDIAEVCKVLANGGVVAVPTETVYGLAANARDPEACRRIFEIKKRPLLDPLIVHVLDMERASCLAHLNPEAELLASKFWPGPLTIILPKKIEVPDIVTAGLPSVAIRMSHHPLLRKILRCSGLDLAAPSANPFGYISPTCAEHVSNTLGDDLAHIMDGGTCEIGIESTIIDLQEGDSPILLRPGVITQEMLSNVLHRQVHTGYKSAKTSQKTITASAPGLFDRHYSPTTPLSLFANGEMPKLCSGGNIAVVYYSKIKAPAPPEHLSAFWLTAGGDPEEAARCIFHLLQRLDQQGFTDIYIELAPDTGLGSAINDRLRKAAGSGQDQP